MNINEQANFIWSIADLLRGDFKQSEYGKVILPFTVLRRFDCVLAPSKAKILETNKTLTVSNAPANSKNTRLTATQSNLICGTTSIAFPKMSVKSWITLKFSG